MRTTWEEEDHLQASYYKQIIPFGLTNLNISKSKWKIFGFVLNL